MYVRPHVVQRQGRVVLHDNMLDVDANQHRPTITLSQIRPLSFSNIAASLPRCSAFALTNAFVKFPANVSNVRSPACRCRAFMLP